MSKKYSQVRIDNPASALTGAEIFVVTQGGESVGTTVQEVATFVGSSVSITSWAFPGGAFPTSPNVLYVATADHGVFGDADYVSTGTWFIANTATPSGFSDFYYK